MGYIPEGMKEMIYTGYEKEFAVYDCAENKPVYQGALTAPELDEDSGDTISKGDFSIVKEPGHYYIKAGNEVSPIFAISDKQYEICTDALLKGFYYQRCGVELTEEYAGVYKHPVCHLQPSYLFCQDVERLLAIDPGKLEQIDTFGGWHDAGDYGRYTVASVKAITDLLLAHDLFPGSFEHPVHIPESCRNGADILHEVKVGLDFLLKMQKKTDGSVYTKVAARYFPGIIMPEQDKEPLLIFDTSSPATAGFAAVMAMAAGAFRELDQQYSDQCMDAAKKAYQWLKTHPEPKLFKNPADVISGEYGDDSDLDERYFAAAAMYRATGEEAYHKDFLTYYHQLNDRMALGWRTMGGYGTIVYLFSKHSKEEAICRDLKQEWLLRAQQLVSRSIRSGYGVTLSTKEYVWGSNGVIFNQSIHLIIAGLLLDSKEFDSVILHNWDYIFGRNTMDICYVTGLGERSVMRPHHRPSAADGIEAPIPGLLSGGPCARLQDEEARNHCTGLPPAKCFVDQTDSYSTNEIDIYWNSPAVFTGAYLCSK